MTNDMAKGAIFPLIIRFTIPLVFSFVFCKPGNEIGLQ